MIGACVFCRLPHQIFQKMYKLSTMLMTISLNRQHISNENASKQKLQKKVTWTTPLP